MKKKIIAVVWCSIVCLPCFLMFCGGGYSLLHFMGIDDGPYLVNLIGIVYSFLLLKCHRFVIPKWRRDTVDTLVRDE